MRLKVSYDPEFDLFYLGEDGYEVEVVEVYPCINLGLNSNGTLIGLEIFAAAKVLGDIIAPLQAGSYVKGVRLNGSLSDLEAQLRPSDGSDFLDYLDHLSELERNEPEPCIILETLRRGIAALLEQVKDGAATG